MSDNGHQLRSLILGPVLCTVLLGAMTLQGRQYRGERDFQPFHDRAAVAINSIPLVIGQWMGKEMDLSQEERNLLQPNAYRCIFFFKPDPDPENIRNALLMITQCRNSNKMSGHFPPKCYPSRGYIQTDEAERGWKIAGMPIYGMEYQFERKDRGQVIKTTIYNFMILPEQGIKPDMNSINASAEDYEQRYYGAAQFQVVFPGTLAEQTPEARKERDQIFAELIAPCMGVIRTLSEGVQEQ